MDVALATEWHLDRCFHTFANTVPHCTNNSTSKKGWGCCSSCSTRRCQTSDSRGDNRTGCCSDSFPSSANARCRPDPLTSHLASYPSACSNQSVEARCYFPERSCPCCRATSTLGCNSCRSRSHNSAAPGKRFANIRSRYQRSFACVFARSLCELLQTCLGNCLETYHGNLGEGDGTKRCTSNCESGSTTRRNEEFLSGFSGHASEIHLSHVGWTLRRVLGN
mmetsp:Transcript_32621/g.82246  ORF Transcript_32621/g.82246 Transcript_32621/m.82246 type:complete len:222 (-) Transcript_32621:38-703(-)